MKIMKKRKIPMRKDIVTGEMMPKRQLIRVVKNKENEVSLDPTGKKPGRGAYVAVDVDIAKRAKKEKTFEKAFHVQLDESFYDELIKYADHLQARQELFGNKKITGLKPPWNRSARPATSKWGRDCLKKYSN